MSDLFGMQFGTQDAIHNPSYSTLKNRLQINLNNPLDKQFDVLTIGAGTGFSVNLNVIQSDTEELLVIEHGLGYKPQTFVYFSLILKQSAQTPASVGYVPELLVLAEGGGGDDTIFPQVDSSTLTIFHTVSSNGTGSGSYTSGAPNYNVQVKYLICNNTHIRTTSVNG